MEKQRKVEVVSKVRKLKIDKTVFVNFSLDAMEKMGVFGEIAIIFCSRKKIKEINKKFRNRDCETDVISFPYTNSGDFIGEVLICLEVAEENAKKYGISFEKELKKLLVHSFLHLIGYDHHNDKGRMARKERFILKSLGVLY